MQNKNSRIITLFLLIGLVGFIIGCESQSSDAPFMISVGDNHTIMLEDNEVYTWGASLYGVLGNGESSIDDNYSTLQNITEKFNLNKGEVITFITSGREHSFALSSEGRVFGWGRNNFNQLHKDGPELILEPMDITDQFELEDGDKIVSISAEFQSVALSLNGEVFVFGDYTPRTEDNYPFTKLTDTLSLDDNEYVVTIDYNRVLTSLGRVFTWGLNDQGQLCDGTREHQDNPVDITDNYLLNDDELISSLLSLDDCAVVTDQNRALVIGVTYHSSSTVDLDSIDFNKEIFDNEFFVIETASSQDFLYFIDNENVVYGVGRNQYGQLLGAKDFVSVPYSEDEFLHALNSYFDLEENETITHAHAGRWHGVVVTSLNNVYLFGRNNYGQLGDGTFEDSNVPVKLIK